MVSPHTRAPRLPNRAAPITSEENAGLHQRANLIALIQIAAKAIAGFQTADLRVGQLAARKEHALLVSRCDSQRPGAAPCAVEQVRRRAVGVHAANPTGRLEIFGARTERP